MMTLWHSQEQTQPIRSLLTWDTVHPTDALIVGTIRSRPRAPAWVHVLHPSCSALQGDGAKKRPAIAVFGSAFDSVNAAWVPCGAMGERCER